MNVGVRRQLWLADVEGTSNNPAYTNPIYSYPAMDVTRPLRRFRLPRHQFPSSYQGSYFFADYAQNWIKRVTFDANGNVKACSSSACQRSR